MIEDWLLKEEEYNAEDKGHGFVNRSITEFTKIIQNLSRTRMGDSYIYKINPLLKFTATLLNILLISLSRDFLFIHIVTAIAFVGFIAVKQEDKKNIIGISIIFPMFTLIILIPSMIGGNISGSLLLIYKVFINIFLVNLTTGTTKIEELLNSMKVLFIPDIFIWIMELTVKYILLLADYSLSALQALKLRTVGKSSKDSEPLSGIMGNLFLNSMRMSDEMNNAMECRGFTGEYKRNINTKFGKMDYIIVVIEVVVLVVYFSF